MPGKSPQASTAAFVQLQQLTLWVPCLAGNLSELHVLDLSNNQLAGS